MVGLWWWGKHKFPWRLLPWAIFGYSIAAESQVNIDIDRLGKTSKDHACKEQVGTSMAELSRKRRFHSALPLYTWYVLYTPWKQEDTALPSGLHLVIAGYSSSRRTPYRRTKYKSIQSMPCGTAAQVQLQALINAPEQRLGASTEGILYHCAKCSTSSFLRCQTSILSRHDVSITLTGSSTQPSASGCFTHTSHAPQRWLGNGSVSNKQRQQSGLGALILPPFQTPNL